MREINTNIIIDTIARLCIESNIFLTDDIKESLEKYRENEDSDLAKHILKVLIENAEIAKEKRRPICQDTGMTIVYIDIGQDVHIVGEDIETAINKGVRIGYKEGYLRKSVVADPLKRVNTQDNTPAIIHYRIVKGDKIDITVSPKGFGSENMSRIKMLKPFEGLEGIKKFVLETVTLAGSNACPPLIVGVGIGGTMEKCAILAKIALLRKVGSINEDESLNEIEKDFLIAVNNLKIGPQGFGGRTTAMAVHIKTFATHIAGLPVCVNTGCNVTRHASATI